MTTCGTKAIVARGTKITAAPNHCRFAQALTAMGVALRTQRALGVALTGCGEWVEGQVRPGPHTCAPPTHITDTHAGHRCRAEWIG